MQNISAWLSSLDVKFTELTINKHFSEGGHILSTLALVYAVAKDRNHTTIKVRLLRLFISRDIHSGWTDLVHLDSDARGKGKQIP